VQAAGLLASIFVVSSFLASLFMVFAASFPYENLSSYNRRVAAVLTYLDR
jgi:predicted membrane channel-forming protein YqfA (hemolysin III family)